MTQTPFDSMTEALAQAPLSEEQRKIWHDLCAELVSARTRIHELEKRVRALNHKNNSDEPAQTILNKPDFNREVARMLASDERYNTISSVLYFDIDNLNMVRERHGNELADNALRDVCDTLLATVRRTDIIGRLAKDELGVLMPRCNNEFAWIKGEQLASMIHNTLSECWGPNLKPSISYGAYTFREDKDVISGLKKAANGLTKLRVRL